MTSRNRRCLPIAADTVAVCFSLATTFSNTARADHCAVPPPACNLPDLPAEGDPQLGPDAANLKLWPVRERDHGAPDCLGGTRTGIWNTFGEFQDYQSSPHYIHTGIDIRTHWDDVHGDVAVLGIDADVWATMGPWSMDLCDSINNCKVFLKTYPHQRYVLYYAHLAAGADAEIHQDVRAKIQDAADTDPNAPLLPGTRELCAGTVLAEIAEFVSGFHHLHFSVFDAAENWDGLDPLDHLPDPEDPVEGPSPYVDETPPEVEQLVLASCVEGFPDGAACSDLNVASGCDGDFVLGEVDIVAKAMDVYHELVDPNLDDGTDSVGVRRAQYRIHKLPDGDPNMGTSIAPTWYDFGHGPWRCRGEVQGIKCTTAAIETDPLWMSPVTEADFVNLADVGDFSGGPELANNFTQWLFSMSPGGLASSSAFAGTEAHYLVLTHEWGLPGSWDTTQWDDGFYQVSAEVWDEAGNYDARHQFYKVKNTGEPFPSVADIVVRDNPLDSGAVPSNPNGEKHWRSPDIKVLPATCAVDDDCLLAAATCAMGACQPPGPLSPSWQFVQAIEVTVGDDFNIWVRTRNIGCNDATDVSFRVASAEPGMWPTWTEIGQSAPAVPVPFEGAPVVLGPVAWSVTAAFENHECLVAMLDGPDDPEPVATFDEIQKGTDGDIPKENNLAQRNITVQCPNCIETDPFLFANGDEVDHEIALGFDCSGFPIHETGAQVQFFVEHDPALASAWAAADGVTLIDHGTELELEFHRCRVLLPPALVAAGAQLEASVAITRPPGDGSGYDLDFFEAAEGVVVGGIVARIPAITPQ